MILIDEDQRTIHAFKQRVTVRGIAAEVALEVGMDLYTIMGRVRTATACRVREWVCYIARQHGFSYSQIGWAMGRDHSTIMNAVRNEERRMAEARALVA